MESSDNQIDKPQRGRPKRAELPDVNINTGAQSIYTETEPTEHMTCLVQSRHFVVCGSGVASLTDSSSLVCLFVCLFVCFLFY